MIKGHGGNIFELARVNGCDPADITDMSSNVNPTGALPGIKAHLAQRLTVIESLPEADAGTITGLFADYSRVRVESVAPGNGSTQLLYAVPRALNTRKALIVGPTYADYASACAQHGAKADFLASTAESGFQPDLDLLATRAGEYDTVFFCNPNNPTGTMAPPADLKALIDSRPETVFIIDESYMPFVAGEEQALPAYNGCPNVIRMTSLSKIFKIPGLRIGFAIAAAPLIDRLQKFAMPWSVNALAGEAVAFILGNLDRAQRFIQETRDHLSIEREALAARFAGNPHIHWFPSCTSFMLARLSGPHTAETVCAALAKQNILIRNCSNFEGLSEKYIRVSLKSRAKNRRFADALARTLEIR